MRDETKIWINYSKENLESAEILLESKLFNPCLQNIQQCIEKALKSVLIEKSIELKRTHSISELKNILFQNGIQIEITEEDCEFLDSIYLPSKYPIGNVLAHYEPDMAICKKGITIAKEIFYNIQKMFE